MQLIFLKYRVVIRVNTLALLAVSWDTNELDIVFRNFSSLTKTIKTIDYEKYH